MVFKKGQKAWNKKDDGLTRYQRYYRKNKEELKIKNKGKHKEYYEKNRDELLEYHRNYREENRQEINKKMREYTNRPEVKNHRQEYNKEYWDKNQIELKIKNKILREKNYEKYNKKVKEWVKNHPEKLKEERERSKANQQIYRILEKKLVLEHYSGKEIKCNCCGEKNIEFLSIDHINGRKSFNHPRRLTGNRLYKWIMNKNYPEGFQVLCMNCNTSKGSFGICAHKGKIQKKPQHERVYKDLNSLKNYYQKQTQETKERIKYEVFSYYSKGKPRCNCCKIEQMDFLTIEHMDGRKNANHDKRKGGIQLCVWLKMNNYPKELRLKILCHNCNWGSRSKIGKCPHKHPDELIEAIFNS